MPLWISLILWGITTFLQNRDEIMKIINEIIDLIRGHPKTERAALWREVGEALRAEAAADGGLKTAALPLCDRPLCRLRDRLRKSAKALE